MKESSRMKIRERMVQNKEAGDDTLHRKLFDINMRLYNVSKNYRALIHSIVEYMIDCLKATYEDYAVVKGISGANVGIPFNIVVIRDVMEVSVIINPRVLKYSRKTKTITSNCGSLNLKTAIDVDRPEWITVGYYDMDSKYKITEKITIAEGGSTLLHEIEHNLGILITDKQKKKRKGKQL